MKCDITIKNRIKRAQGQLKGVLSMMEKDTSCADILAQLKAIRSTIDRSMGLLSAQNLIQTIEADLNVKIDDVQTEDAVHLIMKGQ